MAHARIVSFAWASPPLVTLLLLTLSVSVSVVEGFKWHRDKHNELVSAYTGKDELRLFSFEVNENPFQLLIDFSGDFDRRQQFVACICFQGFHVSDWKLVQDDVPPGSRNVLEERPLEHGAQSFPDEFEQPHFDKSLSEFDCLHAGNATEELLVPPETVNPGGPEARRWRHLHSGFGHTEPEEQKVCIVAHTNETRQVKLVRILPSAGEPINVAVTEHNAILPITFNFRRPTLQVVDHGFFVVPQILQINGFNERADPISLSARMETPMAQFLVSAHSAEMWRIKYNRTQLSNPEETTIRFTPIADDYLGKLFVKEGEDWVARDQSAAEEALMAEIDFQISERDKKFEPRTVHKEKR